MSRVHWCKTSAVVWSTACKAQGTSHWKVLNSFLPPVSCSSMPTRTSHAKHFTVCVVALDRPVFKVGLRNASVSGGCAPSNARSSLERCVPTLRFKSDNLNLVGVSSLRDHMTNNTPRYVFSTCIALCTCEHKPIHATRLDDSVVSANSRTVFLYFV